MRQCVVNFNINFLFRSEFTCSLHVYRHWSKEILRPRSHVSVFVWKRKSFFPFLPSVHTYPMKTVTENANFWKRFPKWKLLKTAFSSSRVDTWKRNFSKTMTSRGRIQITAHAHASVNMSDSQASTLSYLVWFRASLRFCSSMLLFWICKHTSGEDILNAFFSKTRKSDKKLQTTRRLG